MTGSRRRRTEPSGSEPVGEQKRSAKEDETVVVLNDEHEECTLEKEVSVLRKRWELASVLNFLNVFEPVIGRDLKLSAEEIEKGLINPDSSLAKLHVTLLKGIPPINKRLNDSDAWVTVLCNKLASWWPWVAEGEIPLKAAKGEEISRYRGLGPTRRLLILKALCELRVDQDDMVSYISDAIKQGMQISSFRKDKIGGVTNGTSYWYDGNATIGYRLYREVTMLDSKAKSKRKGCSNLPTISFQWETLATNLEEFRKVTGELKSSKDVAEAAVGWTVETDAIPVLENLEKKKERARKKKQRQDMLLNDFRSSYAVGVTRSCRNRAPVNYTCEEYDRVINEAIQITKKRQTTEEKRQERKHSDHGRSYIATNGAADRNTNSEDDFGGESNKVLDDDADRSGREDDPMDSDTKYEMLKEVHSDADDSDYGGKKDDDYNIGTDSSWNSEVDENNEQSQENNKKPGVVRNPVAVGVRWSTRLAGAINHPVVENRNLRTKNRLRQRPTRNSALDPLVVPDTEDENSSKSSDSGESGHEN